MVGVPRMRELRAFLATGLMAASLAGCDGLTDIMDIFGKSKVPLAGERVSVFAERSEPPRGSSDPWRGRC